MRLLNEQPRNRTVEIVHLINTHDSTHTSKYITNMVLL